MQRIEKQITFSVEKKMCTFVPLNFIVMGCLKLDYYYPESTEYRNTGTDKKQAAIAFFYVTRNGGFQYVYCNNNPIRLVDPNGMEVEDWVEDANGEIYWDDNATSQATTKSGEKYLGKNVVVATHNRDANLNEPINSATFDLYLESNHDGPSATINGNTVPTDGTTSGTLAEGLYPARFQGRASYLNKGKTDLALLINEGKTVPTAKGSPKSSMTEIFFHAGNNYQTSLSDSKGKPYSRGCLTGPCMPGSLSTWNNFATQLKGFNGNLYLKGSQQSAPSFPAIDSSLPGLNILKRF